MGSGLALQIRRNYPDITKGYTTACNRLSFEYIKKKGIVYFYKISDRKYIASIFGQEDYGRDSSRVYTDYESLLNGLKTVKNKALRDGLSIAIPYKIGCGLGNGNWKFVEKEIETCFSDSPELIVKIYKYTEKEKIKVW